MKKTWLAPFLLLGVLCFFSCAMGGVSCGNNRVTAGERQTIVVSNSTVAVETGTISGCDDASQPTTVVTSETRTVTSFSKIENRSGLNVVVKINAGAQRVVVEAQQHLLSGIITAVNGDTLVISTKSPFCTTKKAEVTIEVPRLEKIVHAGSGSLKGIGFSGANLDVTLSGSGSATLSGQVQSLYLRSSGSGNLTLQDLIAQHGKISHLSSGNIQGCIATAATIDQGGGGNIILGCDTQRLSLVSKGSGNFTGKLASGTTADVTLTGSGDVKLTGTVATLTATIQGSGSLCARNLQATTVDIHASGSGSAAVCASEKVSGSKNGSGSVSVSCNPKTNSLAG